MPMIKLTVPEGELSADGHESIQRDLAAVLLHWEGAPDNDFFRAQAWSYLVELPSGAQTTAADDAARFLVEVTVPQGALSDRRKEGLVKDATAAVLSAADLSESDALRVWVHIHEQPEGTWGAGGGIIRFADLVALAGEKKEATDA